MALYDQIIKIYPSLTENDFFGPTATIFLQNDSDGKGDYIKLWNNSNPQPTLEQLNAAGI